MINMETDKYMDAANTNSQVSLSTIDGECIGCCTGTEEEEEKETSLTRLIVMPLGPCLLVHCPHFIIVFVRWLSRICPSVRPATDRASQLVNR